MRGRPACNAVRPLSGTFAAVAPPNPATLAASKEVALGAERSSEAPLTPALKPRPSRSINLGRKALEDGYEGFRICAVQGALGDLLGGPHP